MKYGTQLIAVNRVISCVKIQNQLPGRFIKGFNKNINQNTANIPKRIKTNL